MAELATEADVRLLTQVEDTTIASAELIAACIAEAHERVRAALDDLVDLETPPAALVQAESRLAAGILLRALAARDAVEQMELQLGGQRVDAGQRFASLMSIARRFDKEAATLLAPFIPQRAPESPALPSDSTPILGA